MTMALEVLMADALLSSKKTVARITYTVLVETLNPAQSINQSITCLLTIGFDAVTRHITV